MEISVQMDNSEKEFIKNAIASVLREKGKPCILLIYGNKNDKLEKSKVGGLPVVTEGFKIPVSKAHNQMSMLVQINCSELPSNDLYPKAGWVQFWADLTNKNDEGMINGMPDAMTVVTYQPSNKKIVAIEEIDKMYDPPVSGDKFFLYGKDNSIDITFSKAISYPELTGNYEKAVLKLYNKAYGTKYGYLSEIFERFTREKANRYEYKRPTTSIAELAYFWRRITGKQEELERKERDQHMAELWKYTKSLKKEILKDYTLEHDRIGGYVSILSDSIDVVGYDFSGDVILNLIPKDYNELKPIVQAHPECVFECYWYITKKNEILNGGANYTTTFFS